MACGVNAGATSRRSRVWSGGSSSSSDIRPVTPVGSATLGADAEPPVPEHLATDPVGGGLEAGHRAGDQLPTPTDLVVEGVGVTATLGEVQPRVTGPG